MNLYGLVGYPLGHSFSQKYFTEKFSRENLDNCSFRVFPIPDIKEITGIINSNPSLLGLAVTIPYKETVIPYLTSLDHIAKDVGAVNCIKIDGTCLEGFNTDITGFEKSFKPLLLKHHRKALILGTGGASRSVQYVLNKMDFPYKVVSRHIKDGCLTYSSIDKNILDEYNVIINTTPVGMDPDIHSFPPLPYQHVTASHLLFDLVYNPTLTKFLQQGLEKGSTIKNGLEMLIIQAEENWKIWNT